MRKLLAKIRKILRDRRTRRFLTRFVSGAAAIVVFVTTYALVLPAITMEKEANCGIEAHQHDDSCYTEELICDIPESGGHHHDESCYSTTSTLICGMDEHEHSVENGCYDEDGNLICEIKEHRHNDECYEETRELTCQIPESEGHQHTDACYEKVLTCGKEIHIHSTACYENAPVSDSAVAASTSSAAAATTSAGSVLRGFLPFLPTARIRQIKISFSYILAIRTCCFLQHVFYTVPKGIRYKNHVTY